MTYVEREAWLMAAVDIFRQKFEDIGFPLPDKIRVAMGFGPTGGRLESKKLMGVTLNRASASDGVNEIWISPEDAEAPSILETLGHELIHVVLDNEGGHGPKFAKIARAFGFEGPMASTPSSVKLAYDLIQLAERLGPYPGAQVSLTKIFGETATSAPKKQTTRMLKVECRAEKESDCYGYLVRTTKKWLDDVGPPSCPNGHVMEEQA